VGAEFYILKICIKRDYCFMQRFFGTLKDEQDIVFHFGFEGCGGYGEFLALMESRKILCATHEDGRFFMITQNLLSGGLEYVSTVGTKTSPSDLVFIPFTEVYLDCPINVYRELGYAL
jgi:hypothetical protein